MADLEARLHEAFTHGEVLDLEGEDVRVPAEVLTRLLLTDFDGTLGRVPSLRLRHAQVTGKLDVAYGPVSAQISFRHCTFDTAPDFSGASIRTLRLHHCELPGLDARLVHVTGDLDLTDSVVTGKLSVEDGTVEGSFLLRGAEVRVPGGRAVAGGGVRVGGGIFARGIRVEGELRLIGAKLDGGAFLDDAVLRNPDRVALNLDSAQLTRLRLDRVDAVGEIRLRTAKVEGDVSFHDTRLHGSEDSVRARGLQAGEVWVTPAEVEGVFNLPQARVGALRVQRERWPERVHLDGLTYEYVLPAEGDAGDLSRALEYRRWLPEDTRGYRPQPYEELAAYYRRLGHDDDARRVLLAKLRHRRTTLPWWERATGRVVDGLVGYGYRPWLAALWSVLLIGVGWAVFASDPPRALVPDEAPRFSALVYTIDLLVPIGAFGQRTAFDPVGWTHWVADVLIAAGWVLATALIAGVTRNVGRD